MEFVTKHMLQFSLNCTHLVLYDPSHLMEAEVSFNGMCSEEQLSVTVQDHQETVEGLYTYLLFTKYQSNYDLKGQSHEIKRVF
jgi:hypothetical protein